MATDKAETTVQGETKESKAARFARLAPVRVRKTIDNLRKLTTIARSPAYEFNAEQANKLMQYVDTAVDKLRMALVERVNGRSTPPADDIIL